MIFRRAEAASSRRRFCQWTGRSICRRRTTRGPWMRDPAASSGTTSGRRRAARTSATAAWRCGTDYVYFETPDNYLVSLEARTGKERWHKVIADFNQQYFSTMAPVVIGNHVLVGTGNDLDAPGFLQSFDPETGELQWKFYTVPMNPGDPGLETWREPRRRAAWRRAGLDPRRLRSGDEALHLRHRQPDAGLHRRTRRRGQPVHLLADRGQRRHRQDGVVLPDVAARHARLGLGADAGPLRRRRSTASRASSSRPRRATATSSSLDRTTGERLVSASTFGTRVNWAKGLDDKGRPEARSGEGRDDRRVARVAERRRRDELAAAGVQSPTPASSTSPRTTGIRSSI